MKIVNDLDCAHKKVLVRVDFNVPLKDGVIRDDNRIVQALPTIKHLVDNKAKVILFSHLGKVDHKDPAVTEKDKAKNNMAPVATRLGELLGSKVVFVDATRGEAVVKAVNALKDGEVLLLQNTRYEKGETKNDSELASAWAELADCFVMDAFGSAHRAHASTYGVPDILNKTNRPCAIGFLVAREIACLIKCIKDESRPYVAILGGAKVSDKIKVIEKLLEKADKIIVGGAMSYTFLTALGHPVGNSRVEADFVDFAKKCYQSGKIILPVDHVVANDFNNPTVINTTEGVDIPDGMMGLDIGPKTIAFFSKEIASGKTIFWNGPMGVFEDSKFAAGTTAILNAVKDNTGFTVIGGGDTAAAVKLLHFTAADFSHISTGGGASLEMIENNGSLPGIEIINENHHR